MNPLRSLLFGGAVLGCLALLRPHAAAAYQPTDLLGTWEFNSSASGPGAPWWERARAAVAGDGSFTAFTTSSTGEADTIQATFGLASTGVVTLLESSSFRGALDLGTTVMVGTDTWSSGGPGTTEMKVGLKMVGGYGLADVAGEWEINSLGSGPGAPWWQRGRLTVAADGGFTGTFTDNEGLSDPAAGTFSISPGGVVTISISGNARGVMDAGKSVMAMTSVWTGYMAGTVDLSLGVKMAATYTLADLAGTWEFNGLATGPGAPWWSRSQLTIAADGGFTGTTTASDGSSGPLSGTFSIAPDGVITRAGSSAARGVLDAGKTVMVWTDIWSTGSPGTTEMLVATRTSTGTAAVEVEDALAFTLEPVHPNPAWGGAPTIRFAIPSAAPARLELLDVSGRRIAGRDVDGLGAGRHTLDLGAGRRLAPGLYLVRLRQGANVRVRRVVVL